MSIAYSSSPKVQSIGLRSFCKQHVTAFLIVTIPAEQLVISTTVVTRYLAALQFPLQGELGKDAELYSVLFTCEGCCIPSSKQKGCEFQVNFVQ